MTPLWLDGFTANIISPCSTTPDQITFHESSVGDLNDELPLKVPLVAADELPDDTPLTVEIAVVNGASIGQTIDCDIVYGVSDGTKLVRIEIETRNISTIVLHAFVLT